MTNSNSLPTVAPPFPSVAEQRQANRQRLTKSRRIVADAISGWKMAVECVSLSVDGSHDRYEEKALVGACQFLKGQIAEMEKFSEGLRDRLDAMDLASDRAQESGSEPGPINDDEAAPEIPEWASL